MNKNSTSATTTTTPAASAANQNNNNNAKNNNNNRGGKAATATADGSAGPIHVRYPVLSMWEFVLSNAKDPVSGMVYCTDEASQTLMVIPSPLPPSLLSQSASPSLSTATTDICILNANCIVKSTPLDANHNNPAKPATNTKTASSNDATATNTNLEESSLLSFPSTPIHKKALEDRERRAIRQAEEVFRHINEKVTPEGQEVFDRLLKACGEVGWKDESIIVLNQIQVDPPYGPDNCHILTTNNNNTKGGKSSQSSSSSSPSQPPSTSGNIGYNSGSAREGLERVRKIVSDSRKG